ncbi:hypothetical protein CBS147332_9413 [Penicillium roqueforti]|nr:hypothetical protein CBS147332_9413 [Penicillium roqueforti]KAI3097279.1 hypothetical protein CBS147331_9015 [Penicillium roqueforti]
MAQPSRLHPALAGHAHTLHIALSTVGTSSPLLPPNAISRLDRWLKRNPFVVMANTSSRQQLDMVGTLLWNDCTHLISLRGQNPEDMLILGKVRAFAFVVLNMAVMPDLLGDLRALDLAVKAARICIVNQQSEIAVNILSVAATRLSNIQPAHLGLDAAINRTITTQYLLLRMRLAWLHERADIAEHFYGKLPVLHRSHDEEWIFETCFIIGDSALARRLPDIAITWLQRASDHLQSLHMMIKFPYYYDWDLVIRHSLVVACSQVKIPLATAIYDFEMSYLRENYPFHPAVILFDLSMGHGNPSNDGALQALERLVDGMTLTDMNMPIIFQYARSLGHIGGSDDGMEALRRLLMRPLPAGEWTEKCFVAFLLLLSRSDLSDSTRIQALQDVIDSLERRGYPSFSSRASHATLICIWKMTAGAISRNDRWSARLWLQLCSQPKIFQRCSLPIQIVIQKKLVAYYIEAGQLADARWLIDRGIVQSQEDCQRMYLSYKLTLLEGKSGAAHFFLGFPSHPVPHKQLSLLSCAMEAQRQHKPEEVLNCLEPFINCLTSDDIYHHDFPAAEHHMFAITLLSEELSKGGFNQRLGKCIETVLESALSYAKENSLFEGGDREVSVTQLEWLYLATYNVALKLINSSGFLSATHALDHSRDFALQYRQIEYPEGGSKAPRPHLFSVIYLRLLVSTLRARCADPTAKKPHYEDVCICFQQLGDLRGWEDGEETDAGANYKEEKHYNIARFFNLEATMHLNRWQDVVRICASDDTIPDSKFYPQIMDLTLRLNLPPTRAIWLIKRIVSKLNELRDDPPTTWQHDFRASLPRYLHCLFILAIEPDPYASTDRSANLGFKMADAEVAEEVLDKILAMADEEAAVAEERYGTQHSLNAIQVGSEMDYVFTYPAGELINVATMSFNKAIDFYRATRDQDCQRWAEKAIRVAQLVPGAQGKALVNVLQIRLGSLIGV